MPKLTPTHANGNNRASRWRFYLVAFLAWVVGMSAILALIHAGVACYDHRPFDFAAWRRDYTSRWLFLMALLGAAFARGLYEALYSKPPTERPNLAGLLRR